MTDPRTFREALTEFCSDRRRPLVVIVAVLVLLLASGCAGFEQIPYWVQDRQPVAVTATIWSPENPVCNGVESWACADPITGVVTISLLSPPLLWGCLLEHEKRMHLELGYSHRTDGRSLGGVWCNETTFMRIPA